MYEQNEPSSRPTRRQFPGKSAMARIQADNAPGSQADGGVANPTKRQFPNKSAMKAINRAPRIAVQQQQNIGKRRVQPEESTVAANDAPMKNLLSDVYISGFGSR